MHSWNATSFLSSFIVGLPPSRLGDLMKEGGERLRGGGVHDETESAGKTVAQELMVALLAYDLRIIKSVKILAWRRKGSWSPTPAFFDESDSLRSYLWPAGALSGFSVSKTKAHEVGRETWCGGIHGRTLRGKWGGVAQSTLYACMKFSSNKRFFFKETLGLKEKESNFSEAPHTL